ncbi:hypothetical protein Mlab_1376 [Methanocorpusculum labreanum Z]|uniref:Uncharacterized protein n=1 Tax=Methanocorpusculum labreanum (strain ATCC 43576 / DSM 4855 / Z) TaxID=410358 RepID=A2ST86_METLZ|nr:hypothetical protein [Methanocorpusculum labreanum]ABN07542.1 hypothetical protein Mlab_1376 [Methanocorpusculum labreanum Z]
MSKNHTKQIFILLLILFAVFSYTGVATAENETTEISPIVFLTFDKIPQDIISGTEITINVSSEINQSILTTLKDIDGMSITNIAYLVNITSNKLDVTNLTGVAIQLPVSHAWTVNQSDIRVITIMNQTVSVINTSLTDINDNNMDVFQVNLTSLPDELLLVSITNTIMPDTPVATPTHTAETQTQTVTQTPASPAPLLWTVGCLGIGILFAARRRI